MNNKNKIEDEIQFKDILKSPLRMFGWIYPYFFVVIFIVGLFYIKNLDLISLNEIPPALESKSIPEIEMERGGMTPPVNLELISAPTNDLIQKGKELYEVNCLSCHGETGLGDGPAGLVMNPKPRNFLDTDEWTNGRTFSDAYKTLEEGILENGMAAYEIIPPEDRIAMIHYMRTFADFPEITDDEVTTLDMTYGLSMGRTTPNSIPVGLAMNAVASEMENLVDRVAYLVRYFENHPDEPGASLLESKSYNIEKSLVIVETLDGSTSVDDFIIRVSSSPVELGFKAEVSKMSSNEWEELYQYFMKLSELTI